MWIPLLYGQTEILMEAKTMTEFFVRSWVYLDSFFFFSTTLGLELSDTKVYEPEILVLLGTAPHFYEAVVLKLRTVPTVQLSVQEFSEWSVVALKRCTTNVTIVGLPRQSRPPGPRPHHCPPTAAAEPAAGIAPSHSAPPARGEGRFVRLEHTTARMEPRGERGPDGRL